MGDKLADKRALVTGAATGVGLATAKLFVSEGARVVGLDRSWPQQQDGIVCRQGDVTNSDDIEAAVTEAAGAESLDICVANAAILIVDDWLTSDPVEWATVLDVNLLGVMRAFQAAARHMIRTGRGGRLLATASTAGIRAESYSPAYCASKAAVVSLVASAALKFAPHGITVNAVAPGEVDTDMNEYGRVALGALRGRPAAEVLNDMLAGLPLGRVAQPSEIARVFAFLASDDAAYVTGVTIPADGGQLLM